MTISDKTVHHHYGGIFNILPDRWNIKISKEKLIFRAIKGYILLYVSDSDGKVQSYCFLKMN